jgi:hypothetical protein
MSSIAPTALLARVRFAVHDRPQRPHPKMSGHLRGQDQLQCAGERGDLDSLASIKRSERAFSQIFGKTRGTSI